MLGIGFKVSDTSASSLQRPLREFLQREYAPSAATELSAEQLRALDQFATLKSDADLVRAPSSMARHVLLRYYAQLQRMAARFPSDGSLRLQFTWNDSFCPRKKTTQSALPFEMAAVLFNHGALESQLGVQTDRSDAEGLKAACRHFMQAAGAFATVRDVLVDKCTGVRSPDMTAEGLGMLTSLMLAQAQACFYEKAIKDAMKDAIKAKLVHQALDYYSSALEMCNAPALSGTIDRMWAVHVQFQVCCMKAATQYWQAKAAKEVALSRGVGYGEEIARLQAADAECGEALKVGAQNKLPPGLVQSARALQRVIQEQLQTARKDNASIYLENVPKLSELPPVGKASMVKPLVLTPDEVEKELGGVDLFEIFVPNSLLTRAAQVKDEVHAMLTAATERVATSNDQCKAQLHALGLPASIEAFEKTSDNGIPQSIWLKIDHVQRSQGGVHAGQAMQQQLRANDEASERAEKSLRAVESKLSAEEIEDNVCRQNYGNGRWQRPASATLNEGFRLDIDRYYRLVKEAKESDKVVATKLETTHELLALLTQSKPQLDAQLPLLTQDNSSCRDEITAVSTLLLQLSGLMEEKNQVLQDFSTSHEKFDVLPTLQRDPSDATIDHTLADEKRFFQDHFVGKIDAICADELALLDDLKGANAKFETKKAADHVMLERQAFLQRLSDAVDTYDQLQSHLKEGAKFYDELSTRIGQLQQTVDDHCAARDLERREMELHVQADDAVRQREAHDAAVATQMMRDMQLRDEGSNANHANDEAFARQLAGTTPQTFAGSAPSAAPSASSPGLYNLFPQQPQQTQPSQQQQSPSYDYARAQQPRANSPSAPGFAPPPSHPFSAYQQSYQPPQATSNAMAPPPAYSSVFSSSPSSTPQFGNYYYNQQHQQQQQQQSQQSQYPPQQHQQQPPYQPQQQYAQAPNYNGYYQYPGNAPQQQPPNNGGSGAYRPPGGSV